jgi:hypothetical protein
MKRKRSRSLSRSRSQSRSQSPYGYEKYCRCITSVRNKNPSWCNRSKAWGQHRNGRTCYNPYAVCRNSTGIRGRIPSCKSYYQTQKRQQRRRKRSSSPIPKRPRKKRRRRKYSRRS